MRVDQRRSQALLNETRPSGANAGSRPNTEQITAATGGFSHLRLAKEEPGTEDMPDYDLNLVTKHLMISDPGAALVDSKT